MVEKGRYDNWWENNDEGFKSVMNYNDGDGELIAEMKVSFFLNCPEQHPFSSQTRFFIS